MKKYYITTPIYYPSANFHIGHCYTTIIADALARYKRLSGYDVFYQTGTDEHGLKIETKAKEVGLSPKEYVDKIIADAKDLWEKLDISYDYFIRTTDKEHIKSVQQIFKKLYEKGDIYKGEYKGLYCVPCESFWAPNQSSSGKCPDCGRDLTRVSEEAYFFKLSKYQKQLEEHIETHPDFIEPKSRKNEMINNFIKPGLEDLCVSRTSFKWGIPVDFDDKHVIYVWIDALSNYITSLGYPKETESFKKYWPADLQLVGKEIVRFHTIIWPALLMALDLPLPKRVYGHGWLTIDGGKISKSLGNYKDPREYIDAYGVDAVRYFVLREVPFGSDGNFSEEALILRTNNDLCNILGNLLSRTMQMAIKYFDGKITISDKNEKIDNELIITANNLKDSVDKKIEELKVNEALELIFDLFRKCNKYIDETTPWLLSKDEKENKRLETIIYNLLESIRKGSIMLNAFLPQTAKKIFKQLNLEEQSFQDIDKSENYNVGLEKPEILFKRIVK
ncbi:MAG: methionine--tRNA ligase [Mollicutes bacterium]|nr:methionine--tRNA ligase [Mollicutes bacterium]